MSRKNEHVEFALKQDITSNDFDKIRLTHHSLAAIDVDTVDYSTAIGTLKLDCPFYINAMTGGSEFTKNINKDLAYVASRTGLMMAVGSMSTIFKDESSVDSFKVVREVNPNGLILANLNLNHTIEDAKHCISLLNADGIQFHINSPQEITMNEGDRVFSHWKSQVELLNTLSTNVIIKEVGFGMSERTIKELIELNTNIIDVSGKGGTNFISIESLRDNNSFNYLEDWGQSTVESLINARKYSDKATFIASGGIRNPVDIVKALALGASAVGISKALLKSVIEDGVENTIELVTNWQKQIKLIMALLGTRTIKDLNNADYKII